MAHEDSKWPKRETIQATKPEDNNRLCEFLNNKKWKNLNKSGFFKVKHYNPKDKIFQHMSVKAVVFKDKKNRNEQLNRFRNGYIIQHLTIVDFEDVVRTGGNFLEFHERFVCDNMCLQPF